MKITYDRSVDVAYLFLGIEVLNTSQKLPEAALNTMEKA